MTTRYMLVQVEVGSLSELDDEDVTGNDRIPTFGNWADYKELSRQIGQLSFGTAFVRAAFELTDDGLRHDQHLIIRTRQ